MELFIHPRYLLVMENQGSRYLPLPERRFSSVTALTGAVSGVGSGTPGYTLSSQSVYAYGEAKLNLQSALSNEGLR